MPAFVDAISAASGQLLDTGTDSTTDAREIQKQARLVATALQRQGLRRGDRFAILLPNCTEWLVLHFAAAQLGLLTVPLNTRYTRTEITALLRLSGARAIAIAPGFRGLGLTDVLRHVVEADGISLDFVLTVGPADDVPPGSMSWSALLAAAEPDAETDAAMAGVDADTPLIVFGTSGTTSAPKLALHRQGGVVTHAEAVAGALGLTHDDVVLGLLPACGAYGYTVALAALAAGAQLVLLPTFKPEQLSEIIATHGITFLAATEAILRPSLAVPGAKQRLRTWRLGASAGGSVGDVVEALDEVGVRLVNVYGASEALALYALRDPDDPPEVRRLPGGRTVDPGLRVRAVDPHSGEVLETGQSGELQLHGYSVFTEYLGNPEATASAFTSDGWYRSGDHGRVTDDGRTFDYLSRLSDTMRLKGFLVDPAQIEETLLVHELVHEAQVVGVPDERTGEDHAVAFVVPSAGVAPTEEDLRSWCRERLAAFKVPSRIAVIDKIPVTPSANGDKALKRALRDMATQILKDAP